MLRHDSVFGMVSLHAQRLLKAGLLELTEVRISAMLFNAYSKVLALILVVHGPCSFMHRLILASCQVRVFDKGLFQLLGEHVAARSDALNSLDL
eukprot:388716-Amphidinium_carterae.1